MHIPPSVAIQQEAARRLGFEVMPVDTTYGWLFEIIQSAGQREYFIGARSPLNSALGARIADDKHYTAAILERHGYNVPTMARCLRPGRFVGDVYQEHEGMEPGLYLAEQHGFPLIVKPNSRGRGASIHVVNNTRELKAGIEECWQHD